MYPVYRALIRPTGERSNLTPSGDYSIEWHSAKMLEVGFAKDMAEAKRKYGGAPILGKKVK